MRVWAELKKCGVKAYGFRASKRHPSKGVQAWMACCPELKLRKPVKWWHHKASEQPLPKQKQKQATQQGKKERKGKKKRERKAVVPWVPSRMYHTTCAVVAWEDWPGTVGLLRAAFHGERKEERKRKGKKRSKNWGTLGPLLNVPHRLTPGQSSHNFS